jgi:hypothetical protein
MHWPKQERWIRPPGYCVGEPLSLDGEVQVILGEWLRYSVPEVALLALVYHKLAYYKLELTLLTLKYPEYSSLRLPCAAPLKSKTTLNNGYLGSRNDEERSEMRYLV